MVSLQGASVTTGRCSRLTLAVSALATVVLGAGACASGGGGPAEAGSRVGEATASARASALPVIPRVAGAPRLRVEYPDSMQLVAVRDSNFLFGTVGTGDARLTVNGEPVRVEPNGSFLAWLPVPEADTAGVASYTLVARPTGGGRPDTLRHPIRRPVERFTPPDRGPWIDTTSAGLPGVRWATPDELLEVGIRASAGSQVDLLVGNRAFSLDPETWSGGYAATGSAPGQGRWYGATLAAAELERAACAPPAGAGSGAGSGDGSSAPDRPDAGEGTDRRGCLRGAEPDSTELRFVASRRGERAVHTRTFQLRILDPRRLPVAVLREAPDSVHGTNGVVVGRPVAYGSYHWRFPEGTRAAVDARRGDRLRLRLVPGLHAWTDVEDALTVAGGATEPSATVRNVRVEPMADRLRVHVPMESALPLRVDQPDPRVLELDLYGARGATERMVYGRRDGLLESLQWSQLPGPVYRLRVRLSRPVWGYRVRYQRAGGGAAAAGRDVGDPGLVLEIRRPPEIDLDRPLGGRRIAVDPGHPGAGAHGPTGYYEGDANLAIARHLVSMLRERGAHPVLIRRDTLPMGLYERTEAARASGAELFVSIHNNALPDGVRPFGREGTSTFYYHPHSLDLAEAVHRGMLESMGLRDRSVRWGNLAVTRMAWMPSVLTEGAFMMMPRHEAALKTDQFQRAYAGGVLRGLRRFLRERARE